MYRFCNAFSIGMDCKVWFAFNAFSTLSQTICHTVYGRVDIHTLTSHVRKQRTGGTADVNAIYKRYPIMYRIIGWFISFNVVLTVIIFRLIINQFSNLFLKSNFIIASKNDSLKCLFVLLNLNSY